MLIDPEPANGYVVGSVSRSAAAVSIAATSHQDTRWARATSLAARPETTTAATSA